MNMDYDSLDGALAGEEVRAFVELGIRSIKGEEERKAFAKQMEIVSGVLGKHVPYYSELQGLAEKMGVELDDFPKSCCRKSSRIVERVFGDEFGLREVAGFYGKNERGSDHHVWNYDAQRKLYIDLTLYQFDTSFPEIVIVPESVSFLRVNAGLTALHQETYFPELVQLVIICKGRLKKE